jgi:hypothetical protein
MPRTPFRALLLSALCLWPTAARAADPVTDKIKEVAGTAEYLRSVPKHFATLREVDAARRRVTLLTEDDKEPKSWTLTPDAEVKVLGWWGRLDQLTIGDRVWVWMHANRDKKPVGILMIADEPSEQDMHGDGLPLVARGDGSITVKPIKGDNRTLKTGEKLDRLNVGKAVYVQSAGDVARLALDSAGFEQKRSEQRAALRKRWLDDGLPGTVMFLHLSGEMELMLDHEAMRWGRSLKLGDKVTIPTDGKPIPAVVKDVRAWRERTQLRLVAHGADQTDLTPGQRIRLKMPAPPAEVDDSPLPPDLDRPRAKAERVEWFLASIYCPCKVRGDGCTGDFYTLASCNPNACGMPNHVRKLVAEMIDKGMSDKQIYDELRKEFGAGLTRPHLLP